MPYYLVLSNLTDDGARPSRRSRKDQEVNRKLRRWA